MADLKISQLPSATTPLAGTEVLPIVQSSATKQVSIANLTAGRAVSVADATLTTGNLVIGTSGKGIDFSATGQAGGMTSELLNDYEEGTWTPTFTGNGTAGTTTASTLYATYTKVGQIVHVQMYAGLSVTVAPTGYLIISLPFARKANTTFCGATATYNVDLPVGAVNINAIPINQSTSDSNAIFVCPSDDNVWSTIAANGLVTGDVITFGFSYIAV